MSADDTRFPRAAAGVALLVEYAVGRGVAPSTLLSGTGLGVADLEVADGEVTATQELLVVRTLRRVLGEVGADVGARYRITTFGILGYAIVSGHTVRDAMEVALRFLELSFTFALPQVVLVGDQVEIRVDGSALPSDVRRFCVARDSVAIRTVLDSLVPGGVGARLELEADSAVVSFGVAELDRPLAHRSPSSLDVAQALCAGVVTRRRERSGLAQDVRVLITQALPRGAPMGAVAAGLGLSERTLRRRLDELGVGYQELLDEVRESLAGALLRGPATMPVAEVATRLGYAGATSFILAHRRWTGRTPRDPS